MKNYFDGLEKFPIYQYIDSLCKTLKDSSCRTMVLTAETGAGKSTVFPLGLLENFGGNIIMTQPRRLSVLGTSGRLAELLGEECGKTCGYSIHLENCVGPETRLQVVTEAVLLRMLQDDMALEKYNVVVLDEFHERSCNMDMIAAFIKEAQELRDDLYVVIMSATIDAKRISEYFGNAPVVAVPGRTFPVEVEYCPDMSVESAVAKEYNATDDGNILVFLPGIGEINRTRENLLQKFNGIGVEILCLHSSVSMAEQKKILRPAEKGVRRIILSSAIAETSVTVPDVVSVVDSGLSRMNVYDPAIGMEKLVTVAESEFSAMQRTGRAGRTQKGRCVRLWSKSDVRQKQVLPELLRSDLSTVVLECAERGITDLDAIGFMDKPNAVMWNDAVELLTSIGMIEYVATGNVSAVGGEFTADGNVTASGGPFYSSAKITKRGSQSLQLGMDPRMAGIMLASWGNPLSLNYAKTLFLKYGQYSGSGEEIRIKAWNDLIHRLEKCNPKNNEWPQDNKMLLLSGFGDRLAKKVSQAGAEKTEYQFASGRKAVVHQNCRLDSEWIVAPKVDAGKNCAVIFDGESIEGKEFESWLQEHKTLRTECFFENGKVNKRENVCLGKIVLQSKKLEAQDQDIIPAWKNLVESRGIECLPLDDRCRNFLLRVEFYRQQIDAEKKSCKDYGKELELLLVQNFDSWLSPFMGGIKVLESSMVYDALYWYLNGTEIDRQVPEILVFPNGRKLKVVYEKNQSIRPVVEVIIQRIFGCFETPVVMGKKVLLKLLSPASRPLQITEDLENFWTTSWPEICKEMKGRYPKHNWDYRVAE